MPRTQTDSILKIMNEEVECSEMESDDEHLQNVKSIDYEKSQKESGYCE